MGLPQAVSHFLLINNALDLHLGQIDPGLVPAASEARANNSLNVPVTVSYLLLFCDTLYLHLVRMILVWSLPPLEPILPSIQMFLSL